MVSHLWKIGVGLSILLIEVHLWIELAAKKQLKSCKDVGSFCDSKDPITGLCWIRKESYCRYNSPLARILNEQIKPQLSMNFGTPQNPVCTGIKVSDLKKVDWSQVNLDEWLGILAQTNHLPTAGCGNDAQSWSVDLCGQPIEPPKIRNRNQQQAEHFNP